MFVSSRSEQSEFRRRYRWMRIFVVLTFLVFVGRLVQLQIVRGSELRDESIANVVRTVSIPAVRGRIFDDKGRLVATSMPSHTLVATPHYFDMGKAFARLVQLLGLEEADAEAIGQRVSERLVDPKDMRRFQQVTLLEHITTEQLAAIKAHEDELPGVEIVDVPVRHYPYGPMASHLIGYMNEVSSEDVEKKSDVDDPYRAGDRIGRTGLERVFEGDLRGVRGWRKRLVDARGLPLSREASAGIMPESEAQEARAGNDITLTIDAALQKIVEQALGGNPSGAVVVMDVNSGRVLAEVSKPSYDPNMMTNGLTRDQKTALEENPFRPGVDKVAYENYFPGSVFKPFTAMAALEENIITPEDVIHCSGFHEFGRRTFRCPHPHGDVNLRDAIVQSCNVFFYNLAEMTGMDRIARFAKEFGFGERTGVGYTREAPGLIPTRAWYDEKFPGQFRIGHTLNAAIGQGNVKVTLMQVAAAYAAIANGGTLYKPQVVRRIETPDGDVVKEFHPEVRRRTAVSPQYLELIMDALGGVVADEKGTAYTAKSDAVSVAGKTGTAQVAKRARKDTDTLEHFYYVNRDHAWFAAVAPAEAPEIAIIVLIEHGGGGGEHAAPVGVEIARRYFEEVAPRHEEPLIAEKASTKPKGKRNAAIPDEDGQPTTASAHRR
jgi:penicillin-binding protein 2